MLTLNNSRALAIQMYCKTQGYLTRIMLLLLEVQFIVAASWRSGRKNNSRRAILREVARKQTASEKKGYLKQIPACIVQALFLPTHDLYA